MATYTDLTFTKVGNRWRGTWTSDGKRNTVQVSRVSDPSRDGTFKVFAYMTGFDETEIASFNGDTPDNFMFEISVADGISVVFESFKDVDSAKIGG